MQALLDFKSLYVFSFLFEHAMNVQNRTKSLISTLTRLLVIVTIGLAIFIGARMLLIKSDSEMNLDLSPDIVKESSISNALKPARPYSEYSQVIKTRNLFKSSTAKPGQQAVKPQIVDSTAADLTQNLKLVGIVLDNGAQAIIEDSKTHETYFLKVGEEINRARVEKIQEGKVILRYQNKQIELNP